MNTLDLPKHVAIIMDGNGRWATARNMPRAFGHEQGARSARKILEFCVEKVTYLTSLTLFAFSSENWCRPTTEIAILMKIFRRLLLPREIAKLQSHNIQLNVIGDLSPLDDKLRFAIEQAMLATTNNNGLKLNIAINYGGKWDIMQATKKLCAQAAANLLQPQEIDEEIFQNHLALKDQLAPDLLIRTSGEQRISNFLLWHLAYTEIFFTNVLWPDFNSNDFMQAIEFYKNRQRRFGNISDELPTLLSKLS